MKIRESFGFTLIEVVIALFIVSIAFAALLETVVDQSELMIGLRERTLAHWVAVNKANEYQLYRLWPEIGQSDGQVVMGGREWKWELSVAQSGVRGVRRIEVRVAPASAKSDVKSVLVDFLTDPADAGVSP